MESAFRIPQCNGSDESGDRQAGRTSAVTQRSHLIELAWCGWRMRIPSDWRPLVVTGAHAAGLMVLGDAEQALVQVKWSHLRLPATTAPDRWVRRRIRRVAGRRAEAQPAPAGEGFAAALAASHKRRGEQRDVWCALAPEAGLAVELTVRGSIPRRHRSRLEGRVLPSLAADPPEQPTRWAVFQTAFLSPPGFLLRAFRLNLGDIALLLTAGGGRRLLLRQVYPAALALSRRKLPAWLGDHPFRQFRRARPDGEAAPWTAESFARRLEGALQTGVKALPWPLGFVAPRRFVAAGAVDDRLERLLLMEYDGPGDVPAGVAAETIGLMNCAALAETRGASPAANR